MKPTNEDIRYLQTQLKSFAEDLPLEAQLALNLVASVFDTWIDERNTYEAERQARKAQPPLTAAHLADALDCFGNAALTAMHSGTADVAAIAHGIDAVMWRLQEIAKESS